MSWKRLIAMVDRHARLTKELNGIEAEWKKLRMPIVLLNRTRRSAPTLTRSMPTRRRGPNVTSDISKKILGLYGDGKSVQYISKVIKVTPSTVYRCLRKQGAIKSMRPKQSKVMQENTSVSDKVLDVITSMAAKGVVTRATVRKEAKRLFKLNAHQVGQGIFALERQKRVRPDGDTIHIS